MWRVFLTGIERQWNQEWAQMILLLLGYVQYLAFITDMTSAERASLATGIKCIYG